MNQTNRLLCSSFAVCLALGAAVLASAGCAAQTAEESEESVVETREALGKLPVTRDCTYHDALGGHPGTQTLANVGGNWVWQACGAK